jgi:hypothetical protein
MHDPTIVVEKPPAKKGLNRSDVRLSAPLLRGLFDPSAAVRAQCAETVAQALKGTNIRHWFETYVMDTVSSRNACMQCGFEVYRDKERRLH